MNTIFDNAIQSIQLGIEDYEHNDPNMKRCCEATLRSNSVAPNVSLPPSYRALAPVCFSAIW
jgi:hypothetical protein